MIWYTAYNNKIIIVILRHGFFLNTKVTENGVTITIEVLLMMVTKQCSFLNKMYKPDERNPDFQEQRWM